MSCGCNSKRSSTANSSSNSYRKSSTHMAGTRPMSSSILEYLNENKPTGLDYLDVAKFDESTTPKTLLNPEETFTMGKTLGEGGFGKVVLVTGPAGTKYALKILLNPDEKILEEETGTIGALSQYPKCNPDIVCLYDAFQFMENGRKVYGILSELIDGYDLWKAKEMGIKLSPQTIYCIGMWLIRTIKELHDKDYTHKDIKSANIMWDNNADFVKLIDFGLACVRPCDEIKCPMGAKNGRSTVCRASKAGTNFYMPPELLKATNKDLEGADKMMEMYKAYDVYAIGTTLYELLDIHLNDGMGSAYPRDGNENVTSYTYIPIPNVDEDLNAILAAMVAPDPQLRYTIEEAYIEMEAYGKEHNMECFNDETSK